jgi:hypothetical protein
VDLNIFAMRNPLFNGYEGMAGVGLHKFALTKLEFKVLLELNLGIRIRLPQRNRPMTGQSAPTGIS